MKFPTVWLFCQELAIITLSIMNTENYQTNVIQRLLNLRNTIYVLQIHDIYFKGLICGDVDDLMAVFFLKQFVNRARINFTHVVIYLTNSDPEQLLDAYPELNCDELIFISSKTVFDFNILVSNAHVLGWLAKFESKDEKMLNAVLGRDASALNFSQGYPVPPPFAPSSYNFKNLDEDTRKKLQIIFSKNYGESTQIPINELESFIPPNILQSISKFAILRLIAMPEGDFATGLVSVQYGRGNNLRMLLKYIDQLLRTNYYGEYESKEDKTAKLQFVKELVNTNHITLTPMIDDYYKKFVTTHNFDDDNEYFCDGLKVLSWFYRMGVLTEFQTMPTIAYGYDFELHPLIVVENPFSYDFTATVKFYVLHGLIDENVVRSMGITMEI